MKCLERAQHTPGHSHVAILQDDAIVCDDFACWLECLTGHEPDAVIVLWCASQPQRAAQAVHRAYRARESFARLTPHARSWLPAVGVSYPAAVVDDILAWRETYDLRHSRSDDFMLGRWHWARPEQRVLIAVPSIVEHPDDVPSLIGNGAGAHGKNPARSAIFFPP